MELDIPLLLKIVGGFLTAGGLFFFKDYEQHIGRSWAMMLLLFTAFLTISSIFGILFPREPSPVLERTQERHSPIIDELARQWTDR